MNAKLLAYTQINPDFLKTLWRQNEINNDSEDINLYNISDGQAVLFTAIRTCYSKNKPSEIIDLESDKYFKDDNKRFNNLFNRIITSGHTSVLEHVTFTFSIEGVSRSLLAQLTRHRHASFSVQSQRYVKNDLEYIIPESIDGTTRDYYIDIMDDIWEAYDTLRGVGVPQEDARMLLPNAAVTNLVLTMNLRTLFEFYAKRQRNKGAQWEISELAEKLREEVTKVEPWLDEYFDKIIAKEA